MLPKSTPYFPLLLETGTLTMKAKAEYKKLMLYHNILHSDDERIIKQIVKEQKDVARESTWLASVNRLMIKYKITLNPNEVSKLVWKKHIRPRI